jgi:hypothetical protein
MLHEQTDGRGMDIQNETFADLDVAGDAGAKSLKGVVDGFHPPPLSHVGRFSLDDFLHWFPVPAQLDAPAQPTVACTRNIEFQVKFTSVQVLFCSGLV